MEEVRGSIPLESTMTKTVSNKSLFIYAAFLISLVLLAAAFWLDSFQSTKTKREKPIDDPLDVVLDYYNAWLTESKSGNKPTPESALVNNPILSTIAREKVVKSLTRKDALDPVICQTTLPDEVAAKVVHELPNKQQTMVYSRFASTSATGLALVELELIGRTWVIADITCSSGDTLEEREFTFEQSGHLLKNVPAPLDANFWHLVFEENGTPGHNAQLHFDTNSRCTLDGTEQNPCDTTKFIETARAVVQGEMTESGVNVKLISITTPTLE